MTGRLNQQENALLAHITPWVKTQQEQLITDLAEWIAIPSVSRADLAQPGAPFGPDCARVLSAALKLAEQAGFRTEQHSGYAGSVIYGQHTQDIGLISHLDVVPTGENWTYPPFALTRRDDFLIGRGVADNKGPAILNLYLLKLIRDLDIPLHHNLRIIYGLAEETTMADLRWYVEHAPVPALSLVTDSTFPVNFAQKGQISFTLTVGHAGLLAGLRAGNASNSVPGQAEITLNIPPTQVLKEKIAALRGPAAGKTTLHKTADGTVLAAWGRAGHAAFPDNTQNAVGILLSALLELQLLPEQEQRIASCLEKMIASPFGEGAGIAQEDAPSGKLTFNAGCWLSAAADTLTIHCDIRYPVTARGPAIIAALQRQLSGLHPDIHIVPSWRDVAPFYWPEDNPVVMLLQQTWNEVTGRQDAPYAMGGVTHSKVLPRAITFGPAFAPGAGNTPDFLPAGHGLPHGADEALHLPSLLQALPVYLLALIRLDRHLHQQQIIAE